METALWLWGYQVSARTAAISIAIYITASVLIIWLWPKLSVPWSKAKANTQTNKVDLDALTKLIETRSKVRGSIIQVIGGVAALLAFITAIQQLNSNEDAFREKKADLFAKSVKELLASDSKADARAEALYVLSYVARSDRTYHRAVYDAVAAFLTDGAEAACGNYRGESFRREKTIQLAMRIIGERRKDDDPTGKRLNLEGGCFVGLDLLDEWGVIGGFAKARLSGSKMLRADFGKADLSYAQLMGIDAGDYLNPGWTEEIGNRLHKGTDGDDRKGTDDGNERRRFVTHFIDANIEGADFSGAGLQGADFSGAVLKDASFARAVISRASFKGAQKLTAKQLETACVGKPNMTPEQLKSEQPYFSLDLRKEIQSNPFLNGNIPACK
ncbi:pentapeptide repeat-containing protein [Bradyrhizobium sp. WSM3983]|uniref:pentapeptide repeat-containing protein n=1 Tax=Bradyrhizobium sp. WSM3983 TaxID=1038867 RepID=UPI00041CDC7E|nr:pentapeptide repeat-containing protein [Bradyrhizobium sp. WSM3983]